MPFPPGAAPWKANLRGAWPRSDPSRGLGISHGQAREQRLSVRSFTGTRAWAIHIHSGGLYLILSAGQEGIIPLPAH